MTPRSRPGAGRLFGVLLALFPRAFRDAFGGEMRQVFAAQRSAAGSIGAMAICRLWLRTIRGMLGAAWRERRAAGGRSRGPFLQWADLRYTARRLTATPGFTFAVAGTLALCIGANLTIFAAVDSILLRPLPFPGADRLVTIYNTYPRANVMDDGASIANYYERRGRIGALSSLALYRNDAVIVGDAGGAEREFVMRVSPDFFATLGVAPALGRGFREEETVFGADRAVILADGYWRQRYAADPGIVGRTMRVNGAAWTIVGVLPREFRFLSSTAAIFLPLASGSDDRQTRRRHSGSSSRMVARLAPGITLAEAQAQIDAHNAVMERDNPQAAMMANAGFRSVVVPLHARHVESIRPALILLQAGALVLLAIGLVNVGNLFLIRAGSRTKELAVRRAIGARASHIAGAVIAETLLLSAAGTIAGIGIAAGGIALLETLGASRLPLGSQIALRASSIGIAAGVALVTGLLLGAAIALHHLRTEAGDALRVESRGGTSGRAAQRTRHAVLVAQIALSFVLLAGAALLGSGVINLMRVSPGFESAQLLTAQVSLPYARYRTDASLQSFIDRLASGLGRTPGVVAAGIATNIPLSGNANKSAATVMGKPLRRGESPRGVYSYGIAGSYFDAMRIPLLEGRYLTALDVGAASRVCVVDADFARRYWPAGGAVGQRLFPGPAEGPLNEAYTIVGVVAPVKQAALSETDAIGAIYYPYSDRFDRAIYVVTRVSVAPESLLTELRRVVRSQDPELPVNNARTMDTRIADSLIAQRSPAIFGGLFSGVALLLTALGAYGVLSYAVAQRRREIGVRIALGARPAQVRGEVLRAGLRLIAIGIALGIAGAWAAGRSLHALFAGLPQAPVGALAIATVVMVLVCLTACLLPARHAARLSPMDALAKN